MFVSIPSRRWKGCQRTTASLPDPWKGCQRMSASLPEAGKDASVRQHPFRTLGKDALIHFETVFNVLSSGKSIPLHVCNG